MRILFVKFTGLTLAGITPKIKTLAALYPPTMHDLYWRLVWGVFFVFTRFYPLALIYVIQQLLRFISIKKDL